MTKREKEALAARRSALSEFLRNRDGPVDPETLSRSYGIPQPEVERMLKGMRNA